MKKILLIAALASSTLTNCLTRMTPDYCGGSTIWHDDGEVTRITPDYCGGSTIWHPNGGTTRVTPDYCGGYYIWD